MTTIAIHQPHYLPWLGLVERAYQSDVFVILDNVPYSKNYFYNRNRIKGANGPLWITIPVLTKGNTGQLFTETRIVSGQDWRSTHLKSIESCYRKTPFFSEYFPYFEELYQKEWLFLADICEETFRFLLKCFGLKTTLQRASALHVQGKKEDLLIEICEAVGAKRYLSGPDGKKYVDLARWRKEAISIDFQEYLHPVYSQLFGDFIHNLSAIDILFNCGEEGMKILTSNQPTYFKDA